MHQSIPTDDLLNALPDAVWWLEPIRAADGSILNFRVSFANLKAGQITSQPLPAMDAPPDARQPGVPDHYIRVLETNEPVRFEWYAGREDAGEWYDMTATKLGAGVLVSATVSTARKLAEARTGLLDSVLNSLQNGLNVLEAIRDPTTGELTDYRYLAVSHQSTLDTGISREQLLGNTMLTLFPGVRQSDYWPVYLRVLATGQPERFAVHYQADGYDNHLDNYVVLIGPDRLMAVYHLVNDYKRAVADLERAVTNLQQAQALSRSEADLFNTLSRNVPGAGVLVCDSQLRVLFANGNLPDAFTAEPAQLPGKPLAEVLVKEWQQAVQQYFTQALSGHSNSMTELVSEQFYEVYFGPVSNGTGPSTMAMATFRNVTETRRVQQQLEQSVRELQRTNANLEQFAYVASHDLQEPLRKVQSFGDVLQDQYADQLGEGGADLVGRMQSAASRMQVLIRDLLTYSRVATGRDSFRSVDVNEVVRDVLADLDVVITQKQAVIQLEDSMPHLTGDPLQLRQLFQNLVSNALKFGRPGVPPVVRITCQQGPGRTLAWTYSDGANLSLADLDRPFYRIDVIDNGIGFDPQYADRIFQVFQRLHGKQQYQGTGIGLAIVQKVVDNHQGYIVAEGRPGAGATFRVLLPHDLRRLDAGY